MKYYNICIVGLIGLCLGGCKSMHPNPQIDETIPEIVPYIPHYEQKTPKIKSKVEKKEKKVTKIKEAESDVKFFDGLYDPDEISAQIFFAFDSTILSEHDKTVLREKVIFPMQEKQNKILLLVGHSDWRGTPAYNEQLGKRRAQSVAHFLNSLGITQERIEVFSLGSRYATPNLSKPEGIKDRRCDIVFLED